MSPRSPNLELVSRTKISRLTEESVPRPLMFVQMQVIYRFKFLNSTSAIYLRYRPKSTGSNVIVAGTAIFGASDPEGVIAQLKYTVNNALAKVAVK